MLGYSSFFSKCSNFNAHFKNARKNPEKDFCFSDDGASNCCVKVSIFRREYLPSVVNVLTNFVRISDRTKSDFVQLNLPRILENVG